MSEAVSLLTCVCRNSKLANQNLDLSPEGWRQTLSAHLSTSYNEAVLLIGLTACMTAAPFTAEPIGPITFQNSLMTSFQCSCAASAYAEKVFGLRTIWPH